MERQCLFESHRQRRWFTEVELTRGRPKEVPVVHKKRAHPTGVSIMVQVIWGVQTVAKPISCRLIHLHTDMKLKNPEINKYIDAGT